MAKAFGLKTAIESNLDPATGKLATVSQSGSAPGEARGRRDILEMNENRTDEENEKLESKRNDVSKLRAKIGSNRVFGQIDADKSGKIERADLMKILGNYLAPKKEKIIWTG